jgi:hypothetical protein
VAPKSRPRQLVEAPKGGWRAARGSVITAARRPSEAAWRGGRGSPPPRAALSGRIAPCSPAPARRFEFVIRP